MRRIFENNNAKLYLFIVLLALFYGLVFTFSEFYGSPFDGWRDFCILALQWGVIYLATFGLLYLLVLNKYVFSFCFPLLTVICTVLTYFRYTANVSLTPMVIDLAFINDARTCLEVFSFQLVFWIVLSFLFSVGVVYYRFKYIRIERVWLHLLLGLALIGITNEWIPSFVRPVSQRIPYSIYYSLKEYWDGRRVVSQERNTFKGSAVCDADSLTVVFIVGESVRYDHLQLNGYHRSTTPRLAGDSNVVSLPNVYTEPCFTHTSIPHILTCADSICPEKAFEEQSFITLLKQAGYHTSWLANQESVLTYVYFMKECDTLAYVNEGKSLYIFDKWLDGDLIPIYREQLSRPEKKKFILLHTIGSHWWYNSHYTDSFEVYKPVIKSRVISSNTQEEMINSYDNTILYSDDVWYKLIGELKDRRAILFYLSDHGESLGEEGYYTHGVDRPILHRPACFVWYSSSYAESYPEKVRNLKANKDKFYRTDFVFHTVLDAADVRSEYLNPVFSLLNN